MNLSITEAEARVLLRSCGPSPEVIEGWIAEQPWEAAPGGWTFTGDLQGWHFRIEVIPAGLRTSAGEPGTVPATWTVTG